MDGRIESWESSVFYTTMQAVRQKLARDAMLQNLAKQHIAAAEREQRLAGMKDHPLSFGIARALYA